jgi:hypothetical protein
VRGWRGGRGHSARSPCWDSRPCRSRSRRPRLKDGKKGRVKKDFIPKELWRIFDSKALVDFFHL